MVATTSSTVRVYSLAVLPMEPLWSIIKHWMWSTTSRGERGMERGWRREHVRWMGWIIWSHKCEAGLSLVSHKDKGEGVSETLTKSGAT
jgi:hypothetical protein